MKGETVRYEAEIELSVLIVSYNTRELTLACLRSIFGETHAPAFEVIVVDNGSTDGSEEAIRAGFPEVRVFPLTQNLGFSRGNLLAAQHARGRWLLLLNPDTEIRDNAIETIWAFAQQRPGAGIYGGRTIYADGSPNPTYAWGRPTLWSVLCRSLGLTSAFPRVRLLNPEGVAHWLSGVDNEVDIVSGCFLLISRDLWRLLGGFSSEFFMYGEDADLCLRARSLGYRPRVTADATIIHHVGASQPVRAERQIRVAAARIRLIRRHWHPALHGLGMALLAFGIWMRAAAYGALSWLPKRHFSQHAECWRTVWRRRSEWLFSGSSTRTP